ncbi:hypothetical protein [Micromonospora carbonacea]|uniref:Uncharacterized protein n=1 Tax=Micromonospora carbonacea TaxID=47853 RepID=A0A1C4WY06_9ACTN|nr:hypothetical protein [Micromonospora carbonacea]SCF01122.1 hypothetical protein GA0070563_104107 [Micromonospora carbonacea]
MTPIANGPARNTPKGRIEPAPAAYGCRCPGGQPITIASFAEQQLVDVERRHLTSTGCGLPSEHVEPRVYQAGIGRCQATRHFGNTRA